MYHNHSQFPGSPHLRVWEQASTVFSCDSHHGNWQETLLELCPGLMERELAELVAKIQDQDAQVDYVGFLSMFSRPHETYRTGNNMRRLLAGQKPKDAIADTSPPLILAARPPSGLPGVKAQLQKQVRGLLV